MSEPLVTEAVRRFVWRLCLTAGAALWWLLCGSAAGHAQDGAIPVDPSTSVVSTPADTTTLIADAATSVSDTVVPPQEAPPVVQPVQPVRAVQVQPVEPALEPVIQKVVTVIDQQVTQTAGSLKHTLPGDEEPTVPSAVLQGGPQLTAPSVKVPPVAAPTSGTVTTPDETSDPGPAARTRVAADLPPRFAARHDDTSRSIEQTPPHAGGPVTGFTALRSGVADEMGRLSTSDADVPLAPLAPPYDADDVATAGERPVPPGSPAALVSPTSILPPLTPETVVPQHTPPVISHHAGQPDHTPD